MNYFVQFLCLCVLLSDEEEGSGKGAKDGSENIYQDVLASCVPHLEIIICEHDDPQRLTYDTKDTPKHCISDKRIVKSFVNPLGYVG